MTTRRKTRSAGRPRKLCFVTVGATATFNALVSECLSESVLRALSNAEYTHLVIQHGGADSLYSDHYTRAVGATEEPTHGIEISGWAFKDALENDMREAKGGAEGCKEGVVISHAGSGTILDALRIAVPLIVVPNPELLDNHQDELADVLSAQGYVVHGKLGSLDTAIEAAEDLRRLQKDWPPVNSGEPPSKGISGIMDEEMGFPTLD